MTLDRRANLRHLGRHPWLALLCIMGIAVGVAVVLAVDLANESARRAFELSTESITGRATHRIVGGGAGVPNRVMTAVYVDAGHEQAAPVVEAELLLDRPPERALKLLGLAPFLDRPFRPEFASFEAKGFDPARLLTQPNTAVIEASTARELDLQPGDPIPLRFGTDRFELTLIGTFEVQSEARAQALSELVITDVSTAQEVTGRLDTVSRIDLVVEGDEADSTVQQIRALLPPGVTIEPTGRESGALAQMSRAFEFNLQALSLLALVVGMFLIYNTMTFLVVQRRPLLGLLRTHGATRGRVFWVVATEAGLLGVLGTALGLAVGIGLARLLVDLVSRTINDLYFVVRVTDVPLDPWALAKAIALGLGATLAAATVPAFEATRAPPGTVLRRAEVEHRTTRWAARLAALSVLAAAAAAGFLAIESNSLVLGYAGLFTTVLAFALLCPGATALFASGLRPVIRRLFGVIGAMAARGVTSHLSRTAVAITALSIAVATTLGVGSMIASFRGAVVSWLESTLAADIYVTMPSAVAARASEATLDPRLVERIREVEGVESVSTNRSLDALDADATPIRLTALGIGPRTQRRFQLLEGEHDTTWPAFDAGEIIISEPLATRRRLGVGDTLTLRTPEGLHTFEVAGVFRDYASDQGYAIVASQTYRRLWNDPGLTALGLFLEPGADDDGVVQRLEALAEGRVRIRSNRALRENTLDIFDRTFAITSVLQFLTAVVAFIGVLSSLMALQLERAREFAVLRAHGATRRQLFGLILSETTLMGSLAGLFALPLGIALAALLTLEINRRAFGWTLELQVPASQLLWALALAIGAAILAGLYPGWKIQKADPNEALRNE